LQNMTLFSKSSNGIILSKFALKSICSPSSRLQWTLK
jgi:hypothetical protein